MDLATWVLKEDKEDEDEEDDQRIESSKKGEISVKAFKLALGLEGELIESYDDLVFATWDHLLGNAKNPTRPALVGNKNPKLLD